MNPIHDLEGVISKTKLLPHIYKKAGYAFLALTLVVPFALFYSKYFINWKAMDKVDAINWSLTSLYYPIAIGLALILFSREKNEDEMVNLIRFRSFVYGVYLFAVAMLVNPFIGIVMTYFNHPMFSKVTTNSISALTILLSGILIVFRIQLFVARNPSE